MIETACLVVGHGWTAFRLPGVLPGNRIQPVFFLLTIASEDVAKDPRLAVQLGTPACMPSYAARAPQPTLVRARAEMERNGEQRASGAGQDLRGRSQGCAHVLPKCSSMNRKTEEGRSQQEGLFCPSPLKSQHPPRSLELDNTGVQGRSTRRREVTGDLCAWSRVWPAHRGPNAFRCSSDPQP